MKKGVPKFGTKGGKSMKTIVIGNLKGGTGKTTTTVNLSYTLGSCFNKRVLVVDMDPQANTTSVFTKANRMGGTVKNVLQNPDKILSSIRRTKYKNIDIIKGDTFLQEADVIDRLNLRRALARVWDKYDICIIDTRPVFEALTMTALYTAEMLLVPVCLDKFCRDNLALVEEAIDTMPIEVGWRAFANKVDCRRKSQRRVYEDLLERHSYPFMDTCIKNSAMVDNALELSKPVLRHRAGSEAAKDYIELATEILDRLQGER